MNSILDILYEALEPVKDTPRGAESHPGPGPGVPGPAGAGAGQGVGRGGAPLRRERPGRLPAGHPNRGPAGAGGGIREVNRTPG